MHPIIVLVGVSGVGKSSLEAELVRTLPGCQKGVSTTTRNPRPGEVDGQHYHFVSRERFKAMQSNADFVETVQAASNHYGLTRVEVDIKLARGPLLLVLEPHGIQQVQRYYPGRVKTLFLQSPGLLELHRRRQSREGVLVADTARELLDARIAAYESEADHVIPTGTPTEVLVAVHDLMNYYRFVA